MMSTFLFLLIAPEVVVMKTYSATSYHKISILTTHGVQYSSEATLENIDK